MLQFGHWMHIFTRPPSSWSRQPIERLHCCAHIRRMPSVKRPHDTNALPTYAVDVFTMMWNFHLIMLMITSTLAITTAILHTKLATRFHDVGIRYGLMRQSFRAFCLRGHASAFYNNPCNYVACHELSRSSQSACTIGTPNKYGRATDRLQLE